jgi:hypothetical protein
MHLWLTRMQAVAHDTHKYILAAAGALLSTESMPVRRAAWYRKE